MNIKSMLIEFCLFLGAQITEKQIQLYSAYIEREMSPEVFNVVRNRYIKEFLNTRYSNEHISVTLAKLVELSKSKVDIESDANKVATDIIYAIGAFGYTNPKDAEKHMGELAWKVVEQRGGWESVCKNLKTADERIAYAHFRDAAKSIYRRAEEGRLGEKPKLPSSNKLKLITNGLTQKRSIG